jgi:hypothetical protein
LEPVARLAELFLNWSAGTMEILQYQCDALIMDMRKLLQIYASALAIGTRWA